MFRSLCAVLSLVAVIGLVASTARGEEPKKAHGPHGKVKSIDATAGTLVLDGHKGKDGKPDVPEKSFKLAKDVKVTVDGAAKAVADVAAGAIVELTVGEDKTTVTEIAVKTAKKKENK